MNPLKWIRWKMVAVLAAILGVFYFIGLNPLAHREVNDLGAGKLGARWQVNKLNLGLLSGDFNFYDFLLSTPHSKEKDEVFSSKNIEFDFDMDQLLRKRLHGEINVEVPKLTLERRPDGSINVGDLGEDKPSPPTEKPTDWVGTIQDWAKKLKSWDEKRREWQKWRKQPGKKEPGAPEDKLDFSRRVTYPFDQISRFAAQKLSGKGFQIEFKDAASGKTIPPLTDGEISIENISDNPTFYKEPIRWVIKGKIAGAPLELSGHLDMRSPEAAGSAPSGAAGAAAEPKNELRFNIKAEGLPLELANLFAGESLPVHFEKDGKLNLSAEVTLLDLERLNIQPALGFLGARIAPNSGVNKIAGFDAGQFCMAFNEVGTFDLKDMQIGGTLSKPEIKLGNTLQELVVSGGKAFLKNQLDKGLEKGLEKAQDALKKAGADKILDEQGKKIFEGAAKGLEGGLKGLLGGDGKKETPPPAPKEEPPKQPK